MKPMLALAWKMSLAGVCGVMVATPLSAPVAQAAPAVQKVARPGLGWQVTPTGTDARFRGLAAVSRKVAWLAGTGGTVLRTTDAGRTWRGVGPPDAAGLEFRDVEAFDERRAVVLAIGEGDASRVYRTSDGGRTWTLGFRNDEPRAFYDCTTFFDSRHGLAVSDPVDGRFRIISTSDAGRSWRVLPNKGMPDALPGEAAFAASGQCLVSHGGRDVWLATGGASKARVFHSRDRGLTWTVADTPLPSSASQGVFAVAFRDTRHGVAVGGDYRPGEPSPAAAATTSDGGRTWRPAPRPPAEYRSGVVWPTYTGPAALAVGPTGSDGTLNAGRSWTRFDTGSFDTVDCASDGGCWAAGEKGRAGRLTIRAAR
ncbi:WD40/YVTN/BNR-like repeat-containing protein [Actinomadura litoris]|uniref:WD40/YVTN/BNR-like repeat-containing protein n=1 Tax=Actinomadura litoris TaxID=2678616 RepID=UPI001FA7E9C2|nr:oxidoreductase [Actinomadura litoris]